MILNKRSFTFLLVLTGLISNLVQAQNKKRLDGVVAIVGDHIILDSDIDKGFIEANAAGVDTSDKSRCFFLKALLENKLYAHHAVQDSLVVTDLEINNVIERQTDRMVEVFGSMDNALKAYNKKSFEDFRVYFYDIVKANKLADAMQQKIVQDIQITPEEVRQFYNNIPKDELPIIGDQVELSEIVIKPEITKAEKQKVIDKLSEIRRDVLENGSSFTSKVFAYSEDPGSIQSGGLYTITKKDRFVKEFKDVAFSLKEGEISEPFETDFGYHIIYLEKIDGPKLTLRHVLISVKPTAEALVAAKEKAIKIKSSILNNEMTFEEAALSLSDNKETKLNGGIVLNPVTGDTKFEINKIEDPILYSMVSNLDLNQISEPRLISDQRSKDSQYYRIIKVTSKYQEHPADYTIDYLKIREVALMNKKREALQKWIKTNTNNTYIRIIEDYQSCDFAPDWIN